MRGSSVVVVLALVAPACFAELPVVPDATSTGGASETGAPTTGGTSGTSSGVDLDPSSGEVETVGPSAPEGLFACTMPRPCAVWTLPDCGESCTLDEAGSCALERMRRREPALLQVRRCDGACTVDALAVRGSGGPEIRRQSASVGPDEALTNYQPVVMCELRPEAFFAACLESFTPPCADPEQWYEGCGVAAAMDCR